MLVHSEISTDKIDAYRDTHYHLSLEGDVVALKIGIRSVALLRLYGAMGQSRGVRPCGYSLSLHGVARHWRSSPPRA